MSISKSQYIFPPGGGGGGAALTYTTLDAADITKTTDPRTELTGAVTMSGDNFQVPISTNVSWRQINQVVALHFALPGDLCDGTPRILYTRMTFATVPTGDFGVLLGLWDDVVDVGVAAGVMYNVASPGMRAICTRQNSNARSPIKASTATVSNGTVAAVGAFDGVNSIVFSCWSTVEVPATGVSVAAAIDTGSTGTKLATTANTDLIISIPHDTTTADAETLSFKAEYAVGEFPT